MATTLDSAEICALLPHAGRMCLLERVEDWDEGRLRAMTDSHRLPHHPLARDGIVAAAHALEYGAQAMAVHAALLARRAGEPPRGGYLASARRLQLHRERLDDLEEPLYIEAQRQFAQAESLVYDFHLWTGQGSVASGIASVFTR